jgi:histidine ammonia-lyase
MTIRTITGPADLDPGLICAIAADPGSPAASPASPALAASRPAGGGLAPGGPAPGREADGGVAAGLVLRLGPELLGELQRRCEQARAVLRGGAAVYGVNTGMGALSGVRLTGSQQLAHQRNLMLARATGGPPWLDAADVRAIFAVRLRTFLSGDAGVSGQLCQRLADFLTAGIVPAVPRAGVGCAGEIIPLAHAFGPLAGIGQVLEAGGAIRPAADALATRGLGEFVLGPKEGIALLAGVPGATALAIRRAAEARTVAAMMEAAAALSIVAAGASRDPYAAACARGDDILAGLLGRLRALIGDDTAGEGATRALQAPVSFRVAGPVLTQVLRAGDALTAAISRALTGVTDSPAFLDGRFVGTAGFHGIDLAAHCDQLTAAVAHAAEVSVARLHRLLDPRVTGLPAQLARTPGPETGLVTVHKRAAGELHAMRRLATASPVGLIETSGGQEDVQSFGWEAAESLRTALQHARVVTACELLAAYQAVELAGRPAPGGCRDLLSWLAGLIEPIVADRPFGADIERILRAPWPWPAAPRPWPGSGPGE